MSTKNVGSSWGTVHEVPSAIVYSHDQANTTHHGEATLGPTFIDVRRYSNILHDYLKQRTFLGFLPSRHETNDSMKWIQLTQESRNIQAEEAKGEQIALT